ncbi:testis-expressed protein 26 [Ascaphus truei]|uniref:testis-expressed protein 26 n=1 Tax=Ascaphus truei TaxID=8439 RepID=UPI003F5A6BD2
MLCAQLNGDILKPQFMEQLSYLKERSKSLGEKEKCERLAGCLLLSTKLSSNIKHPKSTDLKPQRPQTAMATLGGKMWDPYETTMNREYTRKMCSPTEAVRPKTSKGYRNPYYLSDPVGMSIYTDEFCWKPYSKPDLIRTATSSGERNHKPNPNKTFTIWRLPHEEKKISLDSYSPWIKPPTIEEVQRAMKAQYCSTYKSDYLGIPQGFQVKYAIDAPSDWKNKIPHPLDTESRFNYQIQPQVPELMNFTNKYGCYSNLHLPAKGTVPSVTYAHIKNQENIRQLTTYQRHFGKDYLDLSAVVSSLDPEELKNYLKSVANKERRVLEQFLKTVVGTDKKNFESKSPQIKPNGFIRIPKKM